MTTKDRSGEIRANRPGWNRRAQHANHQALQELWDRNDGEASMKAKNGKKRKKLIADDHNWRVRTTVGGDVVAIEPGGEYEEVFDGGSDPFTAALEFAAKKLRESA